MTIIAYRDGVLAADTQATQGESHRGASITKIAKRGTVLAAAAGAMPGALRFLDWFRSGMPGDTPDLVTTRTQPMASSTLLAIPSCA